MSCDHLKGYHVLDDDTKPVLNQTTLTSATCDESEYPGDEFVMSLTMEKLSKGLPSLSLQEIWSFDIRLLVVEKEKRLTDSESHVSVDKL